jgi:hypothetical protein
MKEGAAIHQSEFMNEIARMFIHGIYMKFHLIISFFHTEFHLVGSVCINKRIHLIAFGHNARM